MKIFCTTYFINHLIQKTTSGPISTGQAEMQIIKKEKSPRKTDVIYANLFELSSGTHMMNRLQKRGLIKEYADKEDKRAKRIELTDKGEKAIKLSNDRIKKNANMLMCSLNEEDQELCIQLLKGIEIELSDYWQKHKGKSFDEVYDELYTEKKMKKI